MKISQEIQQKLLCPDTKDKLECNGEYLVNAINSKIRYPIIEEIPILINSEKSIFSIKDLID